MLNVDKLYVKYHDRLVGALLTLPFYMGYLLWSEKI